MNLQECYKSFGGEYQDVMRRLQSEERIKRFLVMFLNDPSFSQLCSAWDECQYDDVFRAVHTMKGICLNLAFTALLNSCTLLTENLRAGIPDESTEKYVNEVKEKYAQTAAAITAYLK